MMTDATMITFDRGNQRFNFRSVAVIIEQGKVLFHKAGEYDFWCLPGGRVEMGETAAQTVTREIQEEVGVETQAERLLWVVENFFEHEKMHYHELSFYFLLKSQNEIMKTTGLEFESIDNGVPLHFKWFDLEALEGLSILPNFLKTGLQNLPATTVHLIEK